MELSRERRILVTVGVMTGTLLAALEATVVATAMPTVISSLGGLASYSWVFSIYLLTSTVSMPIWGKLSDLYGRRLLYQIGIAVFLLGSALSGAAHSMNQLIIFRAIQGLGAGALTPLALTIIGEIYTIKERTRMQGVFSSVWGLASVGGPLLGGFITDHLSWRWIFYINIPFGLVAAVIIGMSMPARKRTGTPPSIDFAGAFTLITAITLLLLACLETNQHNRGWLSLLVLVGALVFLVIFILIERRAAEPILPLKLFNQRLFLASSISNLLAGCALFGTMSFIPLFMQVVAGTSATTAGMPVMILLVGWVSFAVIGGRLLMRFGYRPLVIIGMILLTIGLSLLALQPAHVNLRLLYFSTAIIGMGMGLSMFSLLIAVQNGVPRDQLGVATSSTQFFRNIGGAVGTAIMGTIMSIGLNYTLTTMHNDIESHGLSRELTRIAENPSIIMDEAARRLFSPESIAYFRVALGGGIHYVFIFSAFIGLCALGSALLVPPGRAVDVERKEPDPSLTPHLAD